MERLNSLPQSRRQIPRNSTSVAIDQDKSHAVPYQHGIGKKEDQYTVKLNVNDLADGEYELEINRSFGWESKKRPTNGFSAKDSEFETGHSS